MFRSLLAGKTRHRAATVAGALAGALAPLAAHASLTVTMSLSPTIAGIATTPTRAYIDPTTTSVSVYVYATVTDSVASPNASSFQGVQYLYYNVNNAITAAGVAGAGASTVDATAGVNNQANAFGAGAFGGAGVSSQVGALVNTAGGLSVGTIGSDLTQMAKPASTANGTVWGPAGLSQTFLVETLKVKPGTFKASTTSGLNATRFFASIPTAAAFATEFGPAYAMANWNEDSTTNTSETANGVTTNGSAGSQRHVQGADPANGTYTTSGTGAAIIYTLLGDCNDNGTVDINDINATIGSYNQASTWGTGDFNQNGTTDINDVNAVIGNFGQGLGGLSPLVLQQLSLIADANPGDAILSSALASVPEPASLGILTFAGAALMGRRRRSTK